MFKVIAVLTMHTIEKIVRELKNTPTEVAIIQYLTEAA